MPIPTRMRALIVSALLEDFGGCAIVQIEAPKPGPGEVLVRVRAAALGFPALLMTRGAYQHKPDLPFVLGGDFCGEVVGLGEGVRSDLMGRQVVGGAATGAMAEFCVSSAESLMAAPEGVDAAQGAAFPSAYLTAHVCLTHNARLEAGEWVLVLGAAGGVGLAAVDLALALGARVIAGASQPEKRAAIAALHPKAHVIDSSRPFKQHVRDISGGGVQVALDPVGGDGFAQALSSLAFAGRLLAVGFASGAIPQLSVNHALIKNVAVLGVRAGEYGRRFPHARTQSVAALTSLWSQQRIAPHVDSVWPFAEWREGMGRLTSRACVGRAILSPAE